jgi:hypothetical protein
MVEIDEVHYFVFVDLDLLLLQHVVVPDVVLIHVEQELEKEEEVVVH